MSKLYIDQLKGRFKNTLTFDNKDIYSFYQSIEPELKESTVNWRIYSLVRKGILNRIGRGKYVLGEMRLFVPEISKKLKTLHNRLNKNYPFLDICLWSTSVFNEFMLHQPVRFYLLVEVEEEARESIFFFMKKHKYSVFLEPDRKLIDRYLSDGEETWIVKSLVSEAPGQKIGGVLTTTIEKMLVDLFCDKILFDSQQGSERDRIFKESFEKYTVNENKMLRYADRRRRKKELNEYLNKKSKYRQQFNFTANL